MNSALRSADERRRHPRQRQPQLYVRIAGRVFHTVEWSFGGLLIEYDQGTLSAGALIHIDGIVGEAAYRRAQAPEPVDIRARVVRVMLSEGVAALSCLKLDDAAYRILARVRDGLDPSGEGLEEDQDE